MSTKKKANIRGKRYTADEKSKVVTYVQDYNTANGRGGQNSAAAKFGISQLTISNWLKSAGVSGKSKGLGSKNSMQNKLATMLTLGQEIAQLERDLNSKRSKFDALKASL